MAWAGDMGAELTRGEGESIFYSLRKSGPYAPQRLLSHEMTDHVRKFPPPPVQFCDFAGAGELKAAPTSRARSYLGSCRRLTGWTLRPWPCGRHTPACWSSRES